MMETIKILLAIGGVALAGMVVYQNRVMARQLKNSMSSFRTSTQSVGHLLEEYKKFKVAFDYAYDAILITDTDAVVLYCNDSFTRVTGYPASEIIGQKAGKLWGGQMPPEFYKKMWRTIKDDRLPFFGTIKNKKKNGRMYRAAVSIAPITNTDGTAVEYFVAVERDLDEKL